MRTPRNHRSARNGLMAAAALVAFVLAAAWSGGSAAAQQATSTPVKKPAKEPAGKAEKGTSKGSSIETVTVARGPFRIDVSVKGYFEPEESFAFRLQPKVWSSFKIADVVPHGAAVKRGEVVLRFDSEQLEKQIEELERKLESSERGLAKMRVERDQSEERVRLSREAVERATENTLHQWETFQKTGHAMAKESAERMLQGARYQLEYAMEELKQLKKMYEADELTEETEEIVLKRTKRAVDSAQWYLKRAELDAVDRLEFTIPRTAAELESAARLAELDRERRERLREIEDEERRLAWEEMERSHRKLEEQLEKHRHDLELMTVRSPLDGVAYYGGLSRGRSGDSVTTAARLRPGATASPGSTLLTIVAARPLRVQADLAEKDLYLVRRHQRCRITATAFPFDAIGGTVVDIDQIPLKPGQFGVTIRVEEIPETAPVMPGMACQAKITAYSKDQAITVPASAVREEEGRWTVEIRGADGKFTSRDVTIGRRTDKKVEVLDGLKPGDKIKKSR